ncbi:MAG: hypothetical protein J7621_08460 [Niastella sp.]|nr:hypothetical protein [Niastella sp.]
METQQPSQSPVAPQPPVLKLSWREKYAGILVLIVGIIYLLWQAIDFLSSRSGAYAVKDGSFNINTSELFNHIRSIISIILAISGGLLLLKGKRAGWVIGVAFLLLLLIIASGIMIAGYAIADNQSKIIGGSFVFLLLMALVFLLLPSARIKYKVGKRTYLPTLVLMLILAVLYYFLQ